MLSSFPLKSGRSYGPDPPLPPPEESYKQPGLGNLAVALQLECQGLLPLAVVF